MIFSLPSQNGIHNVHNITIFLPNGCAFPYWASSTSLHSSHVVSVHIHLHCLQQIKFLSSTHTSSYHLDKPNHHWNNIQFRHQTQLSFYQTQLTHHYDKLHCQQHHYQHAKLKNELKVHRFIFFCTNLEIKQERFIFSTY